ncbi:hypothetical protein V8D89_010013 [Ganoderma adspersum]
MGICPGAGKLHPHPDDERDEGGVLRRVEDIDPRIDGTSRVRPFPFPVPSTCLCPENCQLSLASETTKLPETVANVKTDAAMADCAAERKRVRGIFCASRVEHTQVVEDSIQSVEQAKDVGSVTEGLFALSKLESEAFVKVALSAEVKSVLDSWVGFE